MKFKNISKLQERASDDFYPINDTRSVEGQIKLTMKTKKDLDDLIAGFIEDEIFTREESLAWFRSFGLYYSKLP
ncbi:MAG TPA: hypothetical protein PK006_13095 [Saprospiraceae bacterium]|nr:hypothetical protein [Saprospiraceae bacterium]